MNSWLFRYKLIRDSIHQSLVDLAIGQHNKVLDVGCGNKRYRHLIDCDQYVGTDRFTGQGEGSKPDILSDAAAMPFANSSFDFVLCTEVLEHLPEPALAFSEMNRVLTKGGHLVVSTPLFWPVHEAPHDYYRFTKYGLENLLNKCGFKIEKTAYRGGYAAVSAALFISNMERYVPKLKIMQGLFDLLCSAIQYAAYVHDAVFKNPDIYYGCSIRAVKI